MSSSEQAPEPTMDEILASIRKIIADDDESSASAPEASAEAASGDAVHGALTDEIADAMGQEDASGEAEDDIFDLTHQVHEPAPQPSPAGFAPPPPPAQPAQPHYAAPPQAPEPEPFAASPEARPVPPVTSEAPFAPEPSFADERASEPEDMASAGGVLSGAPMEQAALPESATGFGAADAGQPVEDASWDVPGEAQQVETAVAAEFQQSAEVADLDSFSPGQDIAASGDRVHEAFAESDVVAATMAPQPSGFEQQAGPQEDDFAGMPAESEFATEPVGTDFAAPQIESAFEAVPPSEEAAAVPVSDETIAAPAGEAPDPVIVPPVPEPSLAEEPGAGDEAEEEAPVSAADASRKSLEDSVKEMLRPMLREWLDDNMPRIVESAVRDELQNKHNQY